MDKSLWNFGSGPLPKSTTRDYLEGPRAKIDRAKGHVRDFDLGVGRFLDRKPSRIVVKPGGNAYQHRWVAEVRERIPSELASIIGDAVHNARSALDLLACACVAANARSIKGVSFPIARRSVNVEAAIKDAHIQRASKQIVDVFRLIESYEGGKHEALVTLHDLDRIDKHRLLLPVISVGSIDETTYLDGMNIYSGLHLELFVLEDGAELFRTDAAVYKRKVDDELNVTLQVVFGLDQPLAGKPVTPALTELIQIVEAVVDLFAGLV